MVMQHCLVLEYLNDKDFDGQGNWHDYPKLSQSITMKSDENIESLKFGGQWSPCGD
jgi:hypothetical protein